jgi:hypothetical protein
MPFRSGRHPQTDAVGAEHLAWLRELQLVDARSARVFERARFYDLAGRIHHRDDRDTVRLVADFIGTLFVLDDVLDTGAQAAFSHPLRTRAAIDRIRRAARSGHAPTKRRDVFDSVAAGLADITRRIWQRGAPLHAYHDELDRSLDALVEEARRRTTGFSSVEDYAQVRTAFSAVYACLELGLAATGHVLAPELRSLARATNLSVSYVNDLYSWPKERAVGERSNLVPVLMDQHGLAEPAALRAACRTSDAVVYGYLAARGTASVRDRSAFELLQSWMRGNLDWHAEGTARYVEHLSVAQGTAAPEQAAQALAGA